MYHKFVFPFFKNDKTTDNVGVLLWAVHSYPPVFVWIQKVSVVDYESNLDPDPQNCVKPPIFINQDGPNLETVREHTRYGICNEIW